VQNQIGVSMWSILRVLGRVLACSGVMVAALLAARTALAPINLVELIGLVVGGALIYGALSYPEIRRLWTEVRQGPVKPAVAAPVADPGV
jgi:hypothetical protein